MIVTAHTPMGLKEVQRRPLSRSAVGGTEMSGYGQRATPTFASRPLYARPRNTA